MALYQFRNGIPLTTAAAANFTRGELATALRKVMIFYGFAQILHLQAMDFSILLCFISVSIRVSVRSINLWETMGVLI